MQENEGKKRKGKKRDTWNKKKIERRPRQASPKKIPSNHETTNGKEI